MIFEHSLCLRFGNNDRLLFRIYTSMVKNENYRDNDNSQQNVFSNVIKKLICRIELFRNEVHYIVDKEHLPEGPFQGSSLPGQKIAKLL